MFYEVWEVDFIKGIKIKKIGCFIEHEYATNCAFEHAKTFCEDKEVTICEDNFCGDNYFGAAIFMKGDKP